MILSILENNILRYILIVVKFIAIIIYTYIHLLYQLKIIYLIFKKKYLIINIHEQMYI